MTLKPIDTNQYRKEVRSRESTKETIEKTSSKVFSTDRYRTCAWTIQITHRDRPNSTEGTAEERPSPQREPVKRGRPKRDPPPQTSTKQRRGRRSKSTQTDSDPPKPRQLRNRKRGRPPRSDSDARSQSRTVPTTRRQRIPVKDRWVYASSSSDSGSDREDSTTPAHTPTRGQARYGLRRNRVNKDHNRGCPCCQYTNMVSTRKPRRIQNEDHPLSDERDFNDRKPGRGVAEEIFDDGTGTTVCSGSEI